MIAGESAPFDPSMSIRAFVYSNGVMKDLGTLAGTNVQGGYSSAHGINQLGEIVGESSTTLAFNAPTHAVLYSAGSRTDLGALGGNYSNARGINDSGVIVGETEVVSLSVTNIHAFVYTNGAMHDLGTLGGAYSSAAAINGAGEIVGEAETVINGVTHLHAFLYRNGVMRDLGTLDRLTSSASAIDSAGHVVGYVSNTDKDLNAFFYNGSTMVNLNHFLPPGSGWMSLNTADGINDAGQITGAGTLANGDYHAYLLTPSSGWLYLRTPTILSNGQFQVTVDGISGERFVMQYSTNLANWVSLATNTLSGTTTNFTDTSASARNSSYYRALLLP